jgi:hypothetical protein
MGLAFFAGSGGGGRTFWGWVMDVEDTMEAVLLFWLYWLGYFLFTYVGGINMKLQSVLQGGIVALQQPSLHASNRS